MKSFREGSGRVGLLRLRHPEKWRLLEPTEDWILGVSLMKADYEAGLDECTAAARQALRDLDLVITGGELHESEARIDARSDLSDVVRITIRTPKESGWSHVTFHSGRGWTHEGKEMLGNLREAFERRLKDPAREQS